MMKVIYAIPLLFFILQLYAIPARRHVFKARMSDGTYQMLRFCGDENRSFYLTEDGFIAEQDASGAFYVRTGRRPETLPAARSAKSTGIGLLETAPIRPAGSPKIPVILVNFNDVKMTVEGDDEAIRKYYDRFCNGSRDGNLYKDAGSYGAVRDYFVQQSDSLFLPEFEIIGPVTLSEGMAYYGRNSSTSKDIRFNEFCGEALRLAMELVPHIATDFDNDGNGTVDMAFFIYAGLPESDRGVTPDAIWPKEFISPTAINGVSISVMACCSEKNKIGANIRPGGVGTMCHEIVHSLGIPDQYDLNGMALGMSYWSLMDSGNYCGNGYSPCGLTGYERDFLNWRPLQTLKESCTVRLKPLEEGGVSYKIANEANSDEYYIVENRNASGWDQSLAALGRGMLVVHVDYDRNAWTSNRLNTDGAHQRMSFIPANNKYTGPNNAGTATELMEALSGQPYPGTTGNTSLTNDSEPASVVFTGQFMDKAITGIRELDNGDIVFKFMPKGVLEAPSRLSASGFSENSFTLGWEETPGAECYAVEAYGVAEDGEVTTDLLFSADSIYGTSCRIEPSTSAYKKAACRVMAMAGCYEDSGFSENCLIPLPATAIGEVRGDAGDGQVGIYSLHGVCLGHSESILPDLPEGIYILYKAGKTRKLIKH